MKVSVVIPAYNEEKLLAEVLRSVQAAARSFARIGWDSEIIVCDNNSTDATAQVARDAGAKVAFEPINQISRARNTGAAAATGDWLIFVDADSYPTPELFADVAAEIQSGRSLAGGSTMWMDERHLLADIVTALWNFISRMQNWGAGSFIFCETAAFREIGGFSLELFASEEINLSRRLKRLAKQRGKKVVILHRHPLITSARKLHLYSKREYLSFVIKTIFRPRNIKVREACIPWYDGRR